MAIKIDLLPGYVKLKRNLFRSIAGCVVAVFLVLGGLTMVYTNETLKLQTVEADRDVMTAVATKATTAGTQATTYASQAAPAEGAVNFMVASSRTGSQRAALLTLINRYILGSAIVSSIDVSDGQKLTIKATVKDPQEYALFVRNLRRGADEQGGVLFKGLPVASGPGGFANGAAPFVPPIAPDGEPVPILYPINVTAEGTLLNPVQVPADPVGTAPAAGAPGAPGAPTAPGV
jgi:hypothetical protein